jgi:uncharacterized protein
VIEYEIVDDIDLDGWDVRKALRLFWKSNPAFVEWIQSPIRYIERGGFAERARALLPEAYAVESGMYHYRSMAKNTERAYLRDAQVSLKNISTPCAPCSRCCGWNATLRRRRSNSARCCT